MSYSPFRPDVIWFHCVTPARAGGETLLCDGVNLFQKFDEGTREVFRSKRLKYMYRDILKWGRFLGIDQSVHDKALPLAAGFPGAAFNLDQSGNVDYFEYVVSAISHTKFTSEEAFACSLLDWGYSFEEACFEDNSAISTELLRDLRDLSRNCAVKVELISDDLLMIDNSRVMHGRLEYQDSERRVFVRMCNTDF
jgi:alpha-ketoglutarate-dependent taurine dioxygenase